MKELITYILKSIVKKPENVSVEEEQTGDRAFTLNVKVDPTDCGIAIGKNGIVAKALRDVLKIKGILDQKYYYLNLIVPPQESKDLPAN